MNNHCTILQIFCRFKILQNKHWGKYFASLLTRSFWELTDLWFLVVMILMSLFIFTLRKVSLWFKRQSEFHFSKSRCCRKADPFQGPKPGSCLTLGDELSKETRVHQARDFIGKGTLVENSKVREPRRTALPRGSQGFMVMGGLSESFLVAHISLSQDVC